MVMQNKNIKTEGFIVSTYSATVTSTFIVGRQNAAAFAAKFMQAGMTDQSKQNARDFVEGNRDKMHLTDGIDRDVNVNACEIG